MADETESITFRCPANLLDALDKAAAAGFRSRSGQLLKYITEGLAREAQPKTKESTR